MTAVELRRLLVAFGLLTFIVSAAVRPAIAADVANCFRPGALASCSSRVLEHVEFKSVVLQFIDPAETGLGRGLSRLLWREILESISDLSGAGVILAYDRNGVLREALSGRDPVQFLQTDYHAAAEAIAQQLGVQMSIWGAVLRDNDGLFVQLFLTLRDNAPQPWHVLTARNERGRAPLALSAPIGRERLNLAPLRATRADLFNRRFVTRCRLSAGCPHGIPVRAGASNDAPLLGHVPIGATLLGRDMQNEWLEASTSEHERVFVNIYHVEMFPRTIQFENRNGVNLRKEPGTKAAREAQVNLNGTFEVLNAARSDRDEPWYQIRVDGREGWVAGRLVSRRSWSFPAVHMIAGLYRFARGQYGSAETEFRSFLQASPDEDNVTRSTVHQFRAAARLARGPGAPDLVTSALAELEQATHLTPFDPTTYVLRTVVRLGSGMAVEPGLEDLRTALRLDRTDADALAMLRRIVEIRRQGGLPAMLQGRDPRPVEIEIDRMGSQYLNR